jgi:hypothetical protein
VLVLASGALAGCSTTCTQACRQLVSDCDLAGAMSQTECEETCENQRDLYHHEWHDEIKQDAFDAQLQCIQTSTCDEIAGGGCYDPEVWSF